MPPSRRLTLFTTVSVDALPFLRIVSSTDRLPSERTMFCCTWLPSRTCATSRIKTGTPFNTLSGMVFSASIDVGEPFGWITYCRLPNFARPDGTVTFCATTALVTSCGVRP